MTVTEEEKTKGCCNHFLWKSRKIRKLCGIHSGNRQCQGYSARDNSKKQGTIAIEILEQNPDIDTIVVPIGGGGLSTGIAVAAVMVEILNEQL